MVVRRQAFKKWGGQFPEPCSRGSIGNQATPDEQAVVGKRQRLQLRGCCRKARRRPAPGVRRFLDGPVGSPRDSPKILVTPGLVRGAVGRVGGQSRQPTGRRCPLAGTQFSDDLVCRIDTDSSDRGKFPIAAACQACLNFRKRQIPGLELFDRRKLQKLTTSIQTSTAPAGTRSVDQSEGAIPADRPQIGQTADAAAVAAGIPASQQPGNSGNKLRQRQQLGESGPIAHPSIITLSIDTVNKLDLLCLAVFFWVAGLTVL